MDRRKQCVLRLWLPGSGRLFRRADGGRGHDVFFVARGAHRDAIAKNGLKIESVLGDLHLPKPNVTDDPAKVGPVDIVLFAVKLWDTEKAAEQARPLVGETTRVITAERHRQRGAHRSHSGRRADRGGAAYIATVIAAPGVIKQTSQFAMMRFGRADKEPDATLKAFVNAGKAAQGRSRHYPRYPARVVAEVHFPHGHVRLDGSLRSPIGPIRDDPELRAFVRALMDEAFAVGKAKGVSSLDAAYLEERMNFLAGKIEPGMKASMAHDLERGNRLELDWLSGKVRALG